MFEQTFVNSASRTHKPWTTLVAFILQFMMVIALIIVPLMKPELLTAQAWKSVLVAPAPPPPPPPPPPPVVQVAIKKVIPKQFDGRVLTTPPTIPKEIATIKEDELPPTNTGQGVVGSPGVPYGVPGSNVITDIVSQAPRFTPPPPPPPVKEAPKTVVPKRITVGGNVQQAMLISQPRPAYPALAKQARISGTVRFTAVIGRDGAIANLTLVSGHPLLVQAAQDAVKQWRYRPTLLNGEPVEVLTQIDVNFTLNQ